MNTNDATRVNAEAMPAANSNLHQLDGLLADFLEAKARWNATVAPHEDLTTDCPEYESAAAAVERLIHFQCSSPEDATNKVRMFRDHGWLLEEAEQNLGDFLATLVPTNSDEAASSGPVHPLGFQTDNLPLKQLRALVDTLTTVANVINGLRETPWFASDNDYNEAGRMLNDLREKIECEIGDIRDAVKQRDVATAAEADLKFEILLSGMAHGIDNVTGTVAELVALSADLSRQVSASKELRS